MQWTKYPNEGPFIDIKTSFRLFTDEKKDIIFLVAPGSAGGNSLQRFDGDGWHKLPNANMKHFVTQTSGAIPLDFYWNNDWPNVEFDKMKPLSKSYSINISKINFELSL